MPEPGRFTMKDQQCLLHEDQEAQKWRVAYVPAMATTVETYYRARVVRALEALGLGPVESLNHTAPADLVINGIECELKVARARRKTNGGHRGSPRRAEYYMGLLHDPAKRRHLSGEVLIMLCVDYADLLWPFVVPRLIVGNRRTFEISSHPATYAGQWAPFLEALDYLKPA